MFFLPLVHNIYLFSHCSILSCRFSFQSQHVRFLLTRFYTFLLKNRVFSFCTASHFNFTCLSMIVFALHSLCLASFHLDSPPFKHFHCLFSFFFLPFLGSHSLYLLFRFSFSFELLFCFFLFHCSTVSSRVKHRHILELLQLLQQTWRQTVASFALKHNLSF